MKLLAFILKWGCALFLPFALWGFGIETWQTVKALGRDRSRTLPFAIGFLSFVPLWLFLVSGWDFLTTFEHETTHLLVGLLFFKKPVGFQVSAGEGGMVTLAGGNFLITLAPYFLPTIPLLLLVFPPLLKRELMRPFLFLFGFATSYQILSTWQEFGFRQPDIDSAGIIFSLLFLPVANLVFLGSLLAFVEGHYRRFFSYWGGGFRRAFTGPWRKRAQAPAA